MQYVVIDRFHYIRQVLWAFDKIRREEQKRFSADRRRYFKRSKSYSGLGILDFLRENQQAVEVMLNLSHRLKRSIPLKREVFRVC